MKYVNYAMFVSINNLGTFSFYKTRDKMINTPMFSSLDLINKFIKNNELKKHVIDFINEINEQRCRLSFYKEWKWDRKTTRKSIKSKRTKTIKR